MMIVSSMLRNLLWAFQYPRFDRELVGEHQVGAIRTRLPGCVACQIHYPTNAVSSKHGFHPYFRPEAVQGLGNYSRTDPELLSFLSDKPHPCLMDTEPMGNFPIIIFSHGLGGCMEMYTQLCQQVASLGYFVVAVEHEDGSATYAETKHGDPIFYERPDDTPYSRTKVLNFRTPMLKQRVAEIETVIDYLLENDVQGADTSKPISLLGHSFGAATMTMVSQSSRAKLNAISLLDTWAFSLTDEVLNKGIERIPTLSIISEGWTKNPETEKVLELLANSDTVESLFCPGTVHQSFSDTPCWLPTVIGKKMYMRGANEPRHDNIRSFAKACAGNFQLGLETSGRPDGSSSPIEDQGPLKSFPIQKREEKMNDPIPVSQ